MSALEAMRARVAQAKPNGRGSRKAWSPPQAEDFASGRVLSFDQTLTKTGWADVEVGRPDFPVTVRRGGVLRPDVGDLRGFEQTFAKAGALGEMLESLLEAFDLDAYDAVVHEMPAVQGYRTESSLMAAREVRRVAGARIDVGGSSCRVAMVGRQSAYAVLTGDAHAEKAEMTRAVDRLVPDYCRSTERWTQDVHDAVGLGLRYLHEGSS